MITLPLHLDFTHNIGHKTLLSNFFFFFFEPIFFLNSNPVTAATLSVKISKLLTK